MTLPPPSYPSASPYYSLTKYFARLVKKKVITKQMLRKLLHERTWAKAFELTGMPVRRRHKNHIRLRIEEDGTIGTETEGSDSDSERETDTTESYSSSSCTDAEATGCNKMLRQNALDSPRTVTSSGSSWGSNFGYVRYFDSNTNMHLDETQLIVKGDCTRELFESVPFNIHNNVKTIDTNILLQPPSPEGELNKIFPHSVSTENSSFEARPHLACEDLVNMDQNTQLNRLGESTDFIPIRRSFPNAKAKNDPLPKLWKSTEGKYSPGENISELNSTVTLDAVQHLDPPPSPKRSSPYNIDSIIIDPPLMFRNEEDDLKIINVNLNTDLPFRKHSINSDKKLRRSISRSLMETESFNRHEGAHLQRMSSQSETQKSNKKCECCNRSLCPSPRSSDSGVVGSCNLASPELHMHEYSSSGNAETESDSQEKRESDHMRQEHFENNLRKKLTLSEIEAATFEEQCRCTSPFGSTARTSCVTSVTSENSLDVTDLSNTNVTSTFTSAPPLPSPQIKRTSIRRNIERYVPEIKLKPDPPPRIYRKPSTHIEIPKNVRQPHPCQWSTLNITERTKPSLHYHMRIYRETPDGSNVERQSRVDRPRNRDVCKNDDKDAKYTQVPKTRSRSEDLSKLQKGLTEAQSGFVVYRSDLYAHWWMKAKLPITVVTDSGKDYSFVKRYFLCITGLKIILP